MFLILRDYLEESSYFRLNCYEMNKFDSAAAKVCTEKMNAAQFGVKDPLSLAGAYWLVVPCLSGALVAYLSMLIIRVISRIGGWVHAGFSKK